MSGHSHWASIRHKKGAADARRGKLFSKLARNIIAAARGGSDPDSNLALRYAIERARAARMPKESIEKAIRKGAGELEGTRLEELVYEGMGPEGIQVVVDVLTDNRNRTAAEIRKLFNRSGGKLGGPGSVSWNFELKGRLAVERAAIDEDDLLELVLEAGGEDVEGIEDLYEIRTSPPDFEGVKQALQGRGLELKVCEIARVSRASMPIAEEKAARRVLEFIGDLEDRDDVQRVASNFDIPDELLERIGSEG